MTNCRIASKAWMSGTLNVGDALKIGNKDVEVCISKSGLTLDRFSIVQRGLPLWQVIHQYISGRCYNCIEVQSRSLCTSRFCSNNPSIPHCPHETQIKRTSP
jgi:hypothetical protein